jgi:predicted transcriptional regulator
MKGTYIGELEELILLTVGVLYGHAYGVAVMDEIAKQTGRSLNISAVHAVLTRLEEKGLVSSTMGDPSAERWRSTQADLFCSQAAGKKGA